MYKSTFEIAKLFLETFIFDVIRISVWQGTTKLTNEPRHDKPNKMSVRPAKTQISLGIRPVWSESLLCT